MELDKAARSMIATHLQRGGGFLLPMTDTEAETAAMDAVMATHDVGGWTYDQVMFSAYRVIMYATTYYDLVTVADEPEPETLPRIMSDAELF